MAADPRWRRGGAQLLSYSNLTADPTVSNLDTWYRSDEISLKMRRSGVTYYVTHRGSGNVALDELPMVTGANVAAEGLIGVVPTRDFSDTTTESVWYSLRIPEWYTSSTATIKIVWANGTAQTGGVAKVCSWQVAYSCFTYTDVAASLTTPDTTLTRVNVTMAVDQAVRVPTTTNAGTITAAELVGNPWVGLRLQRIADGTDTCVGDARVMSIVVQIT